MGMEGKGLLTNVGLAVGIQFEWILLLSSE